MEYTVEEINSFVTKKVDLIKSLSLKKDKVPQFNPIYEESVAHAKEMSVHIEGVFPYKLLKEKAPNQDPAEWKYQKEIYLPITMPFFEKALSKLNRIWGNNWNINYKEDATEFSEDTLKTYLENDYPNYNSLVNYFEQIVTKEKINDPNGVVVIKPMYIPMREVINGEEVEMIIDESELIKPIAKFYPSESVIEYVPHKYTLILTNQKSKIKVNGEIKEEGLVFEFYDSENIWMIVQTGDKLDYKFDTILFYNHAWGEVPAFKLKGKPFEKKDTIYYQSYFYPAIPHLNDAIRNFSIKQMSTYTHAFPQKYEYTDGVCDFRNSFAQCDNGTMRFFNPDEQKSIQCPSCMGTGTKKKMSPTGVRQIAISERFEGDKQIPTPPFGFVEPNTEILKYLIDNIDNSTMMAFVFLNMDFSNSSVKGSETALGKMIDRQELFTFLMKISNELFDALEFTIDAIGFMRYGTSYEKPIIHKPKDFEIRSAFDLTEEIGEATTKGIPSFMNIELLKEYIKTRFTNDKSLIQKFELALATDRLFTKKIEEISIGLSSNTIAKWEAVLHDSIYTFIDEAIREEDNFMEKDLSEKIIILITKAQTKVNEIAPKEFMTDGIIGDGQLGKIPLALQQIGLARERANAAGDTDLSKALGAKMDDLLKEI